MKTTHRSWLMWLIASGFFAFQFVLRLFPGLIMQDLMSKFAIDATGFGILSAAYYLGYAGMQIPLGVLLDRYNPRYVISACALICGIGVLSFIYSETWGFIILGRFLIGAGSAVGFLGTAKTIQRAFPENRFTAMIGISFSVGLMGALYGGKPVSLLIDQMGWRVVLKFLSVICFAIAAGVVFLFPKDEAPESPQAFKTSESDLTVFESLRMILKNREIIWVGIAGALLVGPLEGFADVWGVSYLTHVYGFSRPDASLITSFIYFGMLFGGPILSFIAQRLNEYSLVTAGCGLLMGGIFSMLIFMPPEASMPALIALMIIVGILSCYQVIVFTMACKLAPPHLSGLVTSVTNCINMSAGCILHFAMGMIMDQKWTGTITDGIKMYDAQSYTSAVSVIPISLFLGFSAFLLLRKRNNESVPL